MFAWLRISSAAALAGATLVGLVPASAQQFPSGTVTIIVPFAAGGGVDAIARLVAADLGKAWNATVLVENMPGGSGMIAGQALTRAAPDGQTLMLASAGELAVNTTLMADTLSYDVAKDFQPVALAAKIPNVFVVGASGPYQTVSDVIAAAKADPGALTYGSSGIGNPQHLTGALLSYRAGVELSHVPYKGSSQQILDTMGGNIDGTFASAAAVLGNVKDGTLRPIAVTSKERMAVLPDVPTMAETPGLEGFELVNWFGFVTNAGVPADRVAMLHAEIEKSLASEATKQRLDAIGAEFVPMTTEDFSAFLKDETAKFAGVIKDASIKAE